MSTSHTKGPWWDSGLEVGTVPMMDIKVARVSGATFDEAKANARLIAASPDLLEALREVLKHEEWHAASADEVTREARDAIRKARAAIAKATGAA
jgi:hypothetical protein